nr:immunoglobulin heavy chain junction region [Mus musculus]
CARGANYDYDWGFAYW